MGVEKREEEEDWQKRGGGWEKRMIAESGGRTIGKSSWSIMRKVEHTHYIFGAKMIKMIKPRLDFKKMLSNFALCIEQHAMMRGGSLLFFRSSEKRKNFQEKYFLECTGPTVLGAQAKFLQTPTREELTWVNLEFELKFRTVILLSMRRPCGICSPNGPHCISGYLVFRKKNDFLAQLLPVLFLSSLAVLQTCKTFIYFFQGKQPASILYWFCVYVHPPTFAFFFVRSDPQKSHKKCFLKKVLPPPFPHLPWGITHCWWKEGTTYIVEDVALTENNVIIYSPLSFHPWPGTTITTSTTFLGPFIRSSLTKATKKAVYSLEWIFCTFLLFDRPSFGFTWGFSAESSKSSQFRLSKHSNFCYSADLDFPLRTHAS